MKKSLLAFVAAIGLSNPLHAETLVFDATTDFPDTTSGDAPYYIHDRESALAIDAAEESYRGVFARAVTPYPGNGGFYDVTIAALGETDGECEYRFLVNGVVVASAVNLPTSEDYALQNHTFENINIPANAQIAVESNAVSNGLIPEGSAFAFARGRWQTLTLESDDATSGNAVDLALSADVNNNTPAVGESIEITFIVNNHSATTIATQPELLIDLPEQLSMDDNAQCASQTPTTTRCALAEISPGDQRTFTITADTVEQGTADITTTVSADQSDQITTDNTSMVSIQISEQTVDNTAKVDLTVAATSDVSTADPGDIITYSITVGNQHQSNVATSPTIGIQLPEGMSLSASSSCSANNRLVTCNMQELGAGDSTTIEFSATATIQGTATLIVSVSADQPEDSVEDNEVLYSITVNTNDSLEVNPDSGSPAAATPTDTNNAVDSASTGGGTAPFTLLLLVLVTSRLRRRQCF